MRLKNEYTAYYDDEIILCYGQTREEAFKQLSERSKELINHDPDNLNFSGYENGYQAAWN